MVDVLVCQFCFMAFDGLESGDDCPYCEKPMFTWLKAHRSMWIVKIRKIKKVF